MLYKSNSEKKPQIRKNLDKPFWKTHIKQFFVRIRTATFEDIKSLIPILLDSEIQFLLNELVNSGDLVVINDIYSIPIENIGEVKGK